jgi:hypothetical protein
VIVDVNGECYFNVSETESFAAITPELIKECQSHLEEASIIVLDGNVSLDTTRRVLDVASQADVPGEWNFLHLLSYSSIRITICQFITRYEISIMVQSIVRNISNIQYDRKFVRYKNLSKYINLTKWTDILSIFE